MIVGLLRIELHLPQASSLKDKRSILKSLKDRLRGQFNVSIAEIDVNEKWQRASLGIAAVGIDRRYVEGLLREVTDSIRANRLIALIRTEQELL